MTSGLLVSDACLHSGACVTALLEEHKLEPKLRYVHMRCGIVGSLLRRLLDYDSSLIEAI